MISLYRNHTFGRGAEQTAVELGYKILRNKRDERLGIGEQIPSKTDLISGIFGHGITYRVLSGMAYAQPNIVQQLGFVPVGTSTKQGPLMAPKPATKLLKILLTNVAAAYSRAAWEWIVRNGANVAEAAVVLEKRFDDLGLSEDNRVRFWRMLIGGVSGR